MRIRALVTQSRSFRVAVIAAALVYGMGNCQAVQASSGTEGAAFLDIPVGAEPAALGSAYTPLAVDAYAPVWNPAGLGWLDGNQVAGQHVAYLESMHYEFLSFVHPLGDQRDSSTHRGVGFSAQYFGSGDITGTDVSGNPTGTFSSHYGSYNFAYGQTFGERLAVGLTGKWINAQIDDVSANAFAADLGSLYKVNDKLRLAATLMNIGSTLKFLSSGDSLPLAFHVGGAYELNTHWLFTAEGVYPKTGLAAFHAGGEWRPVESVSLRAGYKTDTLDGLSALAGFTTGIGLHFMGQEFAYAWAPYGDLGSAQYFSLLVRFGGREEEKRNLIQYQTIKPQRAVKSQDKNGAEPEYQQLMQLLGDDDNQHYAQSTRPASLEK